MTSQIWTVFKV
ncbi:hypothetical protein CIB84_014391 [Bambusicola thoracicus]|uniref:Uncharacterized protein n=1 Tax=Bambusicola thoracicus TaxID=9083 RepID=A0A2P4SCL8_BAMTH|nr:hypothetical protein CIB84_014391 [Bambusicola thoracicus]